ncbi:hypothetical protein ES705_25809 [subsurface metagenome]
MAAKREDLIRVSNLFFRACSFFIISLLIFLKSGLARSKTTPSSSIHWIISFSNSEKVRIFSALTLIKGYFSLAFNRNFLIKREVFKTFSIFIIFLASRIDPLTADLFNSLPMSSNLEKGGIPS